MEYCLPHLLTKEEIIHILNERQLKIENMEYLSQDELLKIFTTFAVPLARRERETTARHGRHHLETNSALQRLNALGSGGLAEGSMHFDKTIIHGKRHLSMAELNINGEGACAKRLKLLESQDIQMQTLADEFNNTTPIAKRRKVITWP